tara:strand:+ start:638 stop:967 length:330 start_codon:yes stop_codon:yes gene_type:complete
MARKESAAEKRYLKALASSKKRMATLRKDLKNPTRQVTTIAGGAAYAAISKYSPVAEVGGIDMSTIVGLAGFMFGMYGSGKMKNAALDVSTGILTVAAYKYTVPMLERS